MPIPLAIPLAIGAAGIVSDIYNNYKNGQRTEDAYDYIRSEADRVYNQNQADINSYRNYLDDTYGANAGKYDEALANFLDPEKNPVYQNKDFEFTGSINDYYDPAANQRMEAAQAALERAGANGGNRFSSDYVNRSMAAAAAQASEEWEKSYERLMRDRQQQLSEWQSNSQNQWNNYNANQGRLQAGINAYGADRNALVSGLGDMAAATMNNRTANLQTQANAVAGLTNAQNQQPGLLSQIAGPVAQFLGSYYGGK